MKKLTQILLIFSMMIGSFMVPVQFNTQTESIAIPIAEAQSNDFENSTITADCSWNNIACNLGNFFLWYFELIWYKTTQIVAFIAAFTVDVLLFHSINSATYRTGIIEAGWEVLRNFVNIAFIFSLLTIAFKMVLGDTSSKVKSVLIKTIIVALVINFSLFLSYLIIDTSNILGNIFYVRIETEDATPSNLGAGGTSGSLQEFFTGQQFASPSSAIVNNFQPQKIVNNAGGNPSFFERWLIIFAAGGLNVLMIVMFMGIVLLFLGRTVGLIFSTILAPIAFATLTIPFGNATSLPYVGFNTWLKQLISLSFMAPVYLFFLYLIITFSNNEALFNAVSLDSSSGVLGSILGVFIPFAIIATLIYTAKKVTKTMAGELGSQISNTFTQVAKGTVAAAGVIATGGALAAAGGATALGTAARGAGALTKSKRLTSIGKSLQTTKFDISKIPGFKSTFGNSKIANTVAKGLNTSYADVDIKTRQGMNAIRGKASDMISGRTPQAVKSWDDKIAESRKKLRDRREENAKAGFGENRKERAENKAALETEKQELENLKAQKRKQTTDEAKAEKDKITANKESVQKEINREQENLKQTNEKIKETRKKISSATGSAKSALELELKIHQKRKDNSVTEIEKLKKKKDDVDKQSLEGQIKEKEKQIKEMQSDNTAKMYKKDEKTRWTAQDSSFVMNEDKREARVKTQAAESYGSGGTPKKDKSDKKDDGKGSKKPAK